MAERPHPSHRHGRGRPTAVPLSRRLAHPPGPGEIRAGPGVRRGVASSPSEGRGATWPRRGSGRNRVLAAIVRLLDVGFFRIGGEEYAAEHETFGVASLRKEHVTIRDDVMIFDYPAKGSIERALEIRDPISQEVVAALHRRRSGGPNLFAYKDGRRWVAVHADDVNDVHQGGRRRAVLGQGFPDVVGHGPGCCRSGRTRGRAGIAHRSTTGWPPRRPRWPSSSATRRRSVAPPTSTPASSTASTPARRSLIG